jgi:hypothetical protein
MSEGQPLDYEAVCKYVGRLYLESQRQIDFLASRQSSPVIEALRQSLTDAERKVSELEEELRQLKEANV